MTNDELIAEARFWTTGFAPEARDVVPATLFVEKLTALADALEAATKPVTVNTVEELEALPAGAVWRISAGRVEVVPDRWCCDDCKERALPATVLYRPEVAP